MLFLFRPFHSISFPYRDDSPLRSSFSWIVIETHLLFVACHFFSFSMLTIALQFESILFHIHTIQISSISTLYHAPPFHVRAYPGIAVSLRTIHSISFTVRCSSDHYYTIPFLIQSLHFQPSPFHSHTFLVFSLSTHFVFIFMRVFTMPFHGGSW